MRTSLFLKTGAELLALFEARVKDTGNAIATEAQITAGLSEGVQMWANRVLTPRFYALTGGFTHAVYEYTLPNYVRPPFLVQIRSSTYGLIDGVRVEAEDSYTWRTIGGYSVEPTATGGWQIRLPVSPRTDDARILWWAENGPLPATNPTLTASIDADDTSIALTVSGSPDLPQSGYFKVDSEWIGYGGLTRTSATSYTATNCVRGLYETTAASHNISTAVNWGVAADDQRLWVQLMDYVTAYVHAMQLHKSTTEDMSRHEKLMSYYQAKADNFWRKEGYVSQRRPKLNLTTGVFDPAGY